MKYFALAIAVAIVLCANSAHSQTLTTLVEFTGKGGTASGANPAGSLTLSGSTLYGMTQAGGANGAGNVFSVGVNGANYQNLISFTGTGGTASGEFPKGSLAISGTTLYGMTQSGGGKSDGNVFSIGVNGTNYRNLVYFTGTGGSASGMNPLGGLTLAGTTLYGMAQGGANFAGVVFSVGADGTNYQVVVAFTAGAGTANGFNPYGGLTLSGTSLYGMTSAGGANGSGNVFSVGTNGTNYQNLVSFNGAFTPIGRSPNGSLTNSGTTLYGMTEMGGDGADGNVFSVGTNGANYQNLLSFTGTGGAATGIEPNGSLTLSGTTLYGMTWLGGSHAFGNIFSVGIDGSGYRDLYDFTDGSDGAYPQGDLTASGGTLFGMTGNGGNGSGTVFALVLPTPEPSTLALAGSVAAALVSYRWRRRRSRWRVVSRGRRPEDAG